MRWLRIRAGHRKANHEMRGLELWGEWFQRRERRLETELGYLVNDSINQIMQWNPLKNPQYQSLMELHWYDKRIPSDSVEAQNQELCGGTGALCFGPSQTSPSVSLHLAVSMWGFPSGSDGKESACNAGDQGLIPGWGKIPWRRKWQPTPVFLPGKEQATVLAGYSPWGHKELDTTEWFHLHCGPREDSWEFLG